LQFDHAIPSHIDGEPQEPQKRFDVEIVPGSLNLLAPSPKNGKH
jgi:diacylglycerol kinase family enzyme